MQSVWRALRKIAVYRKERFYNLLCIAFGANPVRSRISFRGLFTASTGIKLRTRIQHCDAFHKEISPHIDYELAKGIIKANWLRGPC